MNKLIPIFIIVIIVMGGGGFYGGMKYAESKFSPGHFSNLSSEERQQFKGGGGLHGGFISGEIMAKDDKSITIKLRDTRLPEGQGGSKIVFYSDATEVGKFVDGAIPDFEIGKSVVVNGKANSDGSITAESIQLRPQPQN